jgi:hypothetical protein
VKKILAGTAFLSAVGFIGCQPAVSLHVARGQIINLDARTRLVVWVEGVQTRSSDIEVGSVSKEGEPIHRVLHGDDGNVLFAYDLQISKAGTGGAYHFLLKPAGKGPTFDGNREVTVSSREEAVRVELMEQPGTGRKVEDVFRLVDSEGHASEAHQMIGAHLRRAHEMIYRWIHGD